jgi:predicted transcriptional regulator
MKLDRNRSAVENRLRVLLKASIVDRVPSLTEGDRLAIRYSMIDNANEFLSKVQEICRKF